MDDLKIKVEKAFFEADIPRRLWFTKLGYYKLYGDMRFWWAHYIQITAFIFFVFAMYFLAITALGKQTNHLDKLFTFLLLATVMKAISELLIYDFLHAIKIAFFAGLLALVNIHLL